MTKSQAGRRAAARRLEAGPCTWCGVDTDPDLPVGDPRKATWDHLDPQSFDPRAGYRDRANLVRACSRCNSRRGNRDPSYLTLAPDRPSREW